MADISKIKLPNGDTYDIKDPISYNKVVSRGEQLVVNGSGMLGTNTNWSYWIFDGSYANSSAGSFTRSSTSYADIGSDEFFPVNASEKYKFEFDLISENNTGTMYAYLSFYDVDKKPIIAQTTMYYSGTLTTLARELKAGDTKVYLTDASAYKTYGTGSHLRALIFWDYKNSFGYQYPPEMYSRNVLMPAWTDDSSIDKTNNIITLTTPYTGVTHPAGTYVSQGCSGSTYKYSGINGQTVPTEWAHYTGYFDGFDYSGLNKSGKFPPGTAYCKVGFLWNYNSANDHFWLTNVSVKEVPNDAGNADTAGALTLSTQVTGSTVNDFKGNTFKIARIGSITISGLVDSDGIIMWIPWNNNYGRQLIFDDNTHKTFSRCLNNGTWSAWEAVAMLDKADANALMNALDTGSSTPVDADYYISQYVSGGTTTTTYHRRPMSALWAYIKEKIGSILGLTATNYGGTSAKATADASGNTITTYYAPKSTAVTNVALATNKITKTINGTTTDVVTAASTSAYGITKLNTATNSTSTTEAATPSAVKTAYDLASTANDTAIVALSGVNGTMIYDHTYTISNGVATFTPHVYLKGAEVTTNYNKSCFGWKYRLINGSEVALTTNNDRGCTVTITNLGYGGHVIGTFTPS